MCVLCCSTAVKSTLGPRWRCGSLISYSWTVLFERCIWLRGGTDTHGYAPLLSFTLYTQSAHTAHTGESSRERTSGERYENVEWPASVYSFSRQPRTLRRLLVVVRFPFLFFLINSLAKPVNIPTGKKKPDPRHRWTESEIRCRALCVSVTKDNANTKYGDSMTTHVDLQSCWIATDPHSLDKEWRPTNRTPIVNLNF